MMNCPHCYENINDGATKCHFCKNYIEGKTAQKETKARYKKFWIWLLAILLLYFLSLFMSNLANNTLQSQGTEADLYKSGVRGCVDGFNAREDSKLIQQSKKFEYCECIYDGMDRDFDLTKIVNKDLDILLKIFDNYTEDCSKSLF